MRKTRLTTIAAMASIAAAFAVAPTANAATDYFLEIEGVAGESLAVKDTTSVQSFEWGAVNNTTIGATSGGAGTGKVAFDRLKIQKTIDVATPALFQRLASGQHIPSMELVARKAGTTTPYLRYCLKTVFVTSQQQSGSGGDEAPRESVEFAFGSLQQFYARLGATGTPVSPVFAGWDVMTNLAVGGTYPTACGGTRI